jgi:hypothetical protein
LKNKKGSFGIVYELKNKENDNKYAMKIINKEKVRFFIALKFSPDLMRTFGN